MKTQTQCDHMITQNLILRILQATEKGVLPHVVAGLSCELQFKHAVDLCLDDVSRCNSTKDFGPETEKHPITHLWSSLWCL